MGSLPAENFTAKSGKAFTIRTAQPDDAGAMLAYIRAVAAETEFFVLEPDEFPETEELERAWVKEHLDHPGKIDLLAEATGTIIGNLGFENGPHRRIAHHGVLGIGVARDWRGQGIGTALLERFLKWAADNPLIEKVALEVFATNQTAIRLYKKLGFIEAGRKPRDIKRAPGQYVDTILMHRFV
jgi:RimJ/RimL family protein N-acetyltransferase